MNAVPRRELTSLGSCLTNHKVTTGQKPAVAIRGFLLNDEKMNQQDLKQCNASGGCLETEPKQGERLGNADMALAGVLSG